MDHTIPTDRDISVHKRAEQEYQRWLASGPHAPDITADLKAIAGDPDAVFDRFYRDLSFGTGGLRGPLGAGTNRLNRYTVRRVTAGLGQYIRKTDKNAAERGVVIGYDCRHMSPEFALETALTLCAQGVRAYVFEHLCPTPELSFAVRHLGAAAGVMLTASHNPPQDNGYKVYDHDGCQILPDAADEVTAEIRNTGDLLHVPLAAREEAEAQGLLRFIGADVEAAYDAAVLGAISVPDVTREQRQALSVVYTPLHGTGNVPVRRVLAQAGFSTLQVVPSQELPDGDFPTVQSPNPEEPAALAAAIELAKETAADLVLGTDPDADRVGVAVRTGDGQYQLLSGNQVGGLLVDFWLKTLRDRGELPDNAVVFKTVVTSDLGAVVATSYGVAVEDTLTGFKYIGARATDYEQTGERVFVFGYEESYGYLASPIVRDKDAVQICLLIALMAAAYKQSGKTLVDALSDLYERAGYYQEALQSVTLPGAQGVQQMAALMARLRSEGVEVPGQAPLAMEDYLARIRTFVDGHTEPLTLPESDVVKYLFTDGSWIAVRPSGTEPKLKVYYGAKAETQTACARLLDTMRSAVADILKRGV
ncbi:phospho-sugar mutase [Alicyclobacillus sp. ALC3]|uniref:phospho-sugar mutase n=1 Tax=Alicyclobacillus sp. ALC3 TaxID=2796143 RepID=UPI002378DC4B|nr:phospho-sugar mutase [Alicyclobacillus sp. ALC3]WDL98719.1 phospho-sugar mutase [Alicyclobacillus sp. ALC3]